MLPYAYELPAAILLVLGGGLACFAGYRLFRFVLAIYGFVLGALVASSVVGATNTTGMVTATLIGGVAGALILMFAYFVGIALAGAGLGALCAHVAWARTAGTDPPAVAVIVASTVGALASMVMQRYMIVVATALAGAWTMIVGVLGTAGERFASRAGSAPDTWILYPLNPAPGYAWIRVVWAVLGIVGVAVQLGVTARRR